MPLARTHSIALVGVQGHPVEIEADIENGLVGLHAGRACPTRRCARRGTGSGRRSSNSGEKWPQPQDHRRPVARQPAQARQRLRSRHRGGDPGRRRSAMPAARWSAIDVPRRAGARRQAAPGPRRAARGGRARPRPGSGPSPCRPRTRPEAALVPGHAGGRGAERWARCSSLAARPGSGARERRHRSRSSRAGQRPSRPPGHWPGAGRSGTRPGRRGRPADGPAGGRDLRGGRSPPAAARAAGRWQDHAGRAAARRSCRRSDPTPRWRSPPSTRSRGRCRPAARC